ncbi:hypothetical protein NW759_003502 [Fusarium solani]|jgi:hypothetical protein|nr:hypothetical protein NW759_003502 [Fusarium solani]
MVKRRASHRQESWDKKKALFLQAEAARQPDRPGSPQQRFERVIEPDLRQDGQESRNNLMINSKQEGKTWRDMEPSQVGICLYWIHGNMICCSVLRNKVLIIEKSIHPTSWHPFMDGTQAEETLYLTVQRVLYFT